MKPLAGSTILLNDNENDDKLIDEIEINRRDTHFLDTSTAISSNYGSLSVDTLEGDRIISKSLNILFC